VKPKTIKMLKGSQYPRLTGPLAIGLIALVTGGHTLAASATSNTKGDTDRGAYLVTAAGCVSCHTDSENDGAPFAGGHRLATPYGVFVTPNITPDKETGIGTWTDAEFLAALRGGRAPDGSAYYPSFPYPSYAGMTEQDALDIKAWLDRLAPVRQPNAAHELAWYVPGRWAMQIWQRLFSPWQYGDNPGMDPEWQRGAYLVRHLGHCGECHTPRNIFGALDTARELTGSSSESEPDDGKTVDGTGPNISADRKNGIGAWTRGDLELFLEMGLRPDGDFSGGQMAAVIDDNTALLTPEDRRAIAAFLLKQPAR
jgi:mono/diheme cytochrome c family protein